MHSDDREEVRSVSYARPDIVDLTCLIEKTQHRRAVGIDACTDSDSLRSRPPGRSTGEMRLKVPEQLGSGSTLDPGPYWPLQI